MNSDLVAKLMPVDDASFARVADHYSSDVIVGIVMLAGYYLFITGWPPHWAWNCPKSLWAGS